MLGAIAWIALFGMDTDGDGEADLGPALRLVGIVGFLVAAAACCTCGSAGADDFSAGSGGILGQLVGDSLLRGFGPVGANLFLVALLLISVTLATGLSWLAVMDRIGALGAGLARPAHRGAGKAPSRPRMAARRAPCARSARKCARSIPSARQARAGAASSRRPRRWWRRANAPSASSRSRCSTSATAAGIPPLSLLDDPKPQPKGYDEDTLETLSRQIEFKLKDFRIDAQVVGAYPGPGDHPLRDASRRRASRSARSVRWTRTSRAACQREVGARGRRDPRQVGDRPGNPEHQPRDDLSQRTAALQGIRQVRQPADAGAGQGHRRPADGRRSGAHAAPAGGRHHRLGQVGGGQRDGAEPAVQGQRQGRADADDRPEDAGTVASTRAFRICWRRWSPT